MSGIKTNYNYNPNYNVKTNDDTLPENMTATLVTISEVIYGAICVLGILANLTVIFVVLNNLTKKARSTVVCKCVLHITFCDVIMLLQIPFVIAALYHEYWPLEEWIHRALLSLLVLQQFAKCYLLLFFGIASYMNHRGEIFELSTFRTKTIVFMCWLTAIAIAVPIFFIKITAFRYQIFTASQMDFEYIETFVVIYVTSTFVFPLILLIMLLTRINKEPFDLENPDAMQQPVKLSLYLVSAHLLTITPHIIAQMVMTFRPLAPGIEQPIEMEYYIHISGWIWHLSACIFPVLYAYHWPAYAIGVAGIFNEPNYSHYSSDTIRPLHPNVTQTKEYQAREPNFQPTKSPNIQRQTAIKDRWDIK